MAFCRISNARKNLQQGALASAIGSDYGNSVAPFNIETDITQLDLERVCLVVECRDRSLDVRMAEGRRVTMAKGVILAPESLPIEFDVRPMEPSPSPSI